MVRSLCTSTRESGNPLQAERDILARLDLSRLGKNSLGIIACEQDFIDNGVVAHLCRSLPFDCIGFNTTISAIPGAGDAQQLSIMVLTDDETDFAIGLSEPFANRHRESLHSLFERMRKQVTRDPALILAFAPMLFESSVGNEELFAMLSELGGSTPIFGTLACNYVEGDYCGTRVIYNGEHYDDRAVIVMVNGPAKPRFALATIPQDCIIEQKAVITKSDGSTLIAVNNKPAIAFLDERGLLLDGKLIGAHAFPFRIDPGDGSAPFNRTPYGLTPEGYLRCGGSMPEGAAISLVAQDTSTVMQSVADVVKAVRREEPAGAVLLFSCHSRSINLGFEEMAEVDCINDALGGRIPFLFAYSGGEICPMAEKNALHNDTLVACML